LGIAPVFYLLKPALEHAFWVAALVALPLVAWIVIASQLLGIATDRFYLLKPALEHAFWVAAWVALPLAAWLVIASQLLGHEIERERARATRAYRADFESKMVSDDEGGLVF
jgi:hypothetical protein